MRPPVLTHVRDALHISLRYVPTAYVADGTDVASIDTRPSAVDLTSGDDVVRVIVTGAYV